MNRRVAKITTLQYPLYTSTLFVLAVLLVGAYMYFVSMSVVHVVLRKEAMHSQKEIESEIAILESQYIIAQHRVSDKIAAVEQFSETSDKIFVHRTPPSLVLNSGN